jgi:hypothetical protein
MVLFKKKLNLKKKINKKKLGEKKIVLFKINSAFLKKEKN